ncbi:MAG TPA: VWA domain-containing protein [Bryobacteraceae bacterium]|jgi:VWFA-related protein|nr:VWA domain-containing protein [Bryobacteraceae bacterium]
MRHYSRSRAALASFLSVSLLSCAILAQEDAGKTFRADTRLVVLYASVVGRNGQLITNLNKDQFKVYENNVEQAIRKVLREDVPVSLGLVIDNSGSMRDKRKKVESAALALVKASNKNDEVTIINFNDEAFQDVTFTSDIKKLEEGLTRIDARGGTAMRDAISLAIDYIRDKGKHQKKVIVVVTDGDDNASSTANTLERLVTKAHQSEVLLYMVGLLSEENKRDARRAKNALNTLANASGGTATFPKELDEVEKIAVDIATEIRNQYVVSYTPSNQDLDGSFRSIRVAVNASGSPRVRTRTGYFATPDKNPSPSGKPANPSLSEARP